MRELFFKLITTILFQKNHFLGLNKLICFNSVKVNAAGKVKLIRIEIYFVIARTLNLIDKCCNLTTKHVIHFKRYKTLAWQLVVNHSRWIEWIRIVLRQSKLSWQHIFFFYVSEEIQTWKFV